MAKNTRIIALMAGANAAAIRFLGDRVDAQHLAEGKRTVVLTVTRTGKFFDPRYGEFEITREMLLSMVRNFEADVYGQRIVLDVSHRPQEGSAGFFNRLFLDGNKLRAEIELTEYGIEAIQKKGFIYVSAEFAENFTDNEERKQHGPTLLGAGLTPRPVIKRLDPVQLAEDSLDGEHRTFVSDRIIRILSEETHVMEKYLKMLRDALELKKLHESIIKQLSESLTKAATGIEDDTKLKELTESFITSGAEIAKQLAEAGRSGEPATIQLSITGASASGMDENAVLALMERKQKEAEEKTRKLAEDRHARVDQFNTLLAEAKLEGLSDEEKKELGEFTDLITAETTEDQVKSLAERAIKLGNQLAASKQLAGMGYQIPGARGSVHISVDDSNRIRALQETVDRRLGYLDMSESRRYSTTGGKLQDENKAIADKVLAEFDRQHGAQLHQEAKMLAAGDGVVADVAVPATFERTVIREALHRMIGLQFVNSGTLQFAASHLIPYSYRDTTAAGRNNTRVYEGGSIPRAGVIQTHETAYPIPQKIAFEVSDELRYLTAAGHLDWNAVSENAANAVRIIGEDTDQLIFNEALRASDEYGAVAVSNEVIADAATDGTKNIFPLLYFPVVRPRKVYDMAGSQVGSTVNPVTVEYDSGGGYAPVTEYDGTGTQSAGTYYVLDYNLGEIYLCSELGAIVTPGATHNIRVSYSYATNIYNFDTDLGTDATDVHWDGFLYRYGLRKSVIEDDRYHMANFGLMSGSVMTQVEQAKQFGANAKRNGTDLATDGNLGRIKDVPNYKGTAPGLWMGDQRVLLGERGQTRFRMMKPWSMGEMEDQRDANGRFTGKKEAYGDQFIVLHTPTQLKRAYTSIGLYSSSARVARAA